MSFTSTPTHGAFLRAKRGQSPLTTTSLLMLAPSTAVLKARSSRRQAQTNPMRVDKRECLVIAKARHLRVRGVLRVVPLALWYTHYTFRSAPWDDFSRLPWQVLWDSWVCGLLTR
eukprot:2094091-Amphidinium_carterae.1